MSNDANVALAEKLHSKQDAMMPEQLNMRDVVGRPTPLHETPVRSAGVMDEQFPTADLTAKDPRDRATVAKLQLAQAAGSANGYTPFGKMEATDADFAWYQRKAAAAETANFQAWFAHEFDRMSPAEKKRAKELYPEFYRQRKKLLKQQSKNLFELARLKLEGVQTMDDLQTLYLAENGRLDLGPLQNLLHPEQMMSFNGQMNDKQRTVYAQAKFQRGLLSPFRVFGDSGQPIIDGTSNDFIPRTTQALGNKHGFEKRAFAGVNTIGFGAGFPPFPSNTPAAQDAQWWQVLKGGQ